MRNIKVLNSNILKIYYYAMAIACLWVFIEVGKTEKKKKQNKTNKKTKKRSIARTIFGVLEKSQPSCGR
jgi:uncharacterized membrane protein YhaH (DUF805 family)